MTHIRKTIGCLSLLLAAMPAIAQQEGDNQLDVSLQMLGHGEMRLGGLEASDPANEETKSKENAYFLMERTRLTLNYKRTGLETKVTAQHNGVWGQSGKGNFNLNEAWAKLSMKNGLFAQIGRQALAYDDERIIGTNDWAMASLTHDVFRFGYEGHGHKAHAILAFNQNVENTYGGTYYTNGGQAYKTMHTLWYHYDLPKMPLGASLLFMNIGMQAGEKDGEGDKAPRTEYQQLLGAYVCYAPKDLKVEASYYHQMGKNEDGIKIDAWMASLYARKQLNRQLAVVTGYDYLSGDKYFAVPAQGMIGYTQHKVIKGFNPVYGSHHRFYGLMDYFYVQTYFDGFTPGLQQVYVGAEYKPIDRLTLRTKYHYMAIATKLEDTDMTLGHDIDIEAAYQIMDDVQFSAGFSYMTGTETMEKLKRADHNESLRWGWFSLIISPRIFSTKW